MKTTLALSLLVLAAPLVDAADKKLRRPGVPIYNAPTAATTVAAAPATGETYVYDQQPIAGAPVLVTREQADGVVAKFKEAYPKLGNPRILIYVNRELVDDTSGMRLTSRNEKINSSRSSVNSTIEPGSRSSNGNVTITAGGNVNVGGTDWDYPGRGKVTKSTENTTAENRYSSTNNRPTLADRQTVRDLERLFGRPLRAAGVALADQGTATQLIANRPLKEMMLNTEGEQARKDREALAKVTDVVLEILISSRNVNVPEVSGNKTYGSPDIQATAIRLSDSKIIGQASSRDIIGKDRYAGRILRNFDVEEIAEATALALMEDMTK